jgi:haloalkane dehalogenase
VVNVSHELYPFDEHWLDLEGKDGSAVRMHYVDEGPRDGPVVLLVHGNPTWSFYWRNLVFALRATHRVIAVDHVGCGKSDKPGDEVYPYRLERRVEDLEALVNTLGLEDVTLGVHDWGGMIGFSWAHRNPEKVGRFIVLNTGAFHLPRTARMSKRISIGRDLKVGALLIRGFNAFALGATKMAVTEKKLHKDVRDGLVAPYDSWDNRRAVLRFVQDIPLEPGDPGYDLVSEVGDALPQFNDRPILICWGMRDFVFTKHFLETFEEKLPSAEVHRFERAGHYVMEEKAEEIVELVQGFLDVDTLKRGAA